MAYVDTGIGDPIVFLHGNPTSSYLWRNVIPHLEPLGRCLAPDLIGMGRSGASSSGRYRFEDHARYLDAWFEAANVGTNIILVIHDWGGALGFDWARRHRERVQAIVYMETILCELTWNDWPDAARKIFQAMRSPTGEDIILQKNVFVERILPSSILRPLTGEEMDAYRTRFTEPGETRRPTLTWPREIPFEGQPADVAKIVADSAAWVSTDRSLPKLFINADPGSILIGKQREFCRSWPNQQEVTVKGLHFIQEDSPHEIGEAAAAFVRHLRH
jgi:haloalkane dehalogenase